MLDYVALFFLVFSATVVFYGIIAIHDIPYDIAHKRNHPHQDAIHVAGWVSLLTLHVIWPFLWIWATLYRADRGWGFKNEDGETDHHQLGNLEQQVRELSHRIQQLEQQGDPALATAIHPTTREGE